MRVLQEHIFFSIITTKHLIVFSQLLKLLINITYTPYIQFIFNTLHVKDEIKVQKPKNQYKKEKKKLNIYSNASISITQTL